MSLIIGKREFAPSLGATAATLVGLTIFLGLAYWQLTRATEKRELLTALTAQTIPVELRADTVGELPRYQPVRARGHYDTAHQILLDNAPSAQGRPGYQVLTPFVSALDSSVILVNRGWVPLGRTRNDLPDITVTEEALTLSAQVDELPRPGMRLGEPALPAGWPKVLSYPQYTDLENLFGSRLLKPLLLLDPNEPHGYERLWRERYGSGPERHIAYAVQWLAFACTLLVIYFFLNSQRLDAPKHHDSQS
jgi:surfeit locus 1 family protein